MQTFGSFLVAVLAASMATAAVIPERAVPKGTFEVHQVRNANFKGHSGPLALAKAYNKFGKALPEDLKNAVSAVKAKRSTGLEAATAAEYDQEYYCQVEIGTPAQTLALDFDTGSSDLWVFSSLTKPKSDDTGHTIYNPSDSSTAKVLSGASWSIVYGDGSSSSGSVYTDAVTIGGLTVSDQAVETAKTVSSAFVQDTYIDGLVGLAFSSINTVTPKQQQTWFSNVLPQLSSPLFSANLKHQAASSYLFGGIDTTQYTGELYYTPISTAQGFWEWTATGYAVGSGDFTSESIDSIADTGTSLLLLPVDVVDAYYGQVSGASYSNSQGGYVFDCSADLPDFTFGVGSGTITVPGAYINYAPVTSSQCFGGLQSSAGIGINIFGDVALKSAYVVFDNSGPQIGWAAKST